MTDDEMMIVKQLKGTTLRVYYTMLRVYRPMSLREVQRKADLSSPSLALHHLDKLRNLGLVDLLPEGGYFISRMVRVGILRFFIGRGRLLIPRYVFYFVFFAGEMIGYLLLFGLDISPIGILLIMTLTLACTFSLVEALLMWQAQPIGFHQN